MRKTTVFCIALMAAIAAAAPGSFEIKKLPSGSTPAVDGEISGWGEAYFLDSLKSNDNVYYGTDNWAPSMYQFNVYAAHDEAKVYFVVAVTCDPTNTVCGTQNGWSNCDNIKINPGGQAMAFYVWANGTSYLNPSCPYTLNSTVFCTSNPTGSKGTLPAYEFSLDKTVIDPFGMNTFQLSVGSEDNVVFAAVGAEYTGNKHDDASNPWDNPLYYPTFTLAETEGPPISVESSLPQGKAGNSLTASPNPFRPATFILFTSAEKGLLSIYNVAGKVVRSFPVSAGNGKVQWDARDRAGKPLSAGIYIARLENSRSTQNLRLFLAR